MWIYTVLVARTRDSRYFARFAFVVWTGQGIIWYLYLTVQDDNSNILSRVWSPIAIAVVAAAVATISILRPDTSDTTHYKPIDQSLDGGAIELGGFHVGNDGGFKDSHDEPAGKKGLGAGKEGTGITIERGRPSTLSLLTSIDVVGDVGVFACGPLGLMEDVRSAVSALRKGHSCRRRTPNSIYLYEETFEL
jgi:hypothetical protein